MPGLYYQLKFKACTTQRSSKCILMKSKLKKYNIFTKIKIIHSMTDREALFNLWCSKFSQLLVDSNRILQVAEKEYQNMDFHNSPKKFVLKVFKT